MSLTGNLKSSFISKEKNLSQVLKRGNNNLDLIRIIMAFMVIFGHSFALSPKQNLTEPFAYFFHFTYSGSIAVKVFFFISGILVTNSLLSSKSIKSYIISRSLRIYPAFAATIIITGLIIGPLSYAGDISSYYASVGLHNYIVQSLKLNTQFFIDGVFSGNRDGGSVNGSLWTISLEISAYFVVLAAFMMSVFNNRIIANIICGMVIILPLTSIEGLNFITEKTGEAYLLPPCFALGVLYAVNKDLIKVNLYIPIAFFIIYKTTYSINLSQFSFYAGICTSLLYISSLEIAKKVKIQHDISYGIYLWGFPIQQTICFFYKPDTAMLFISSIILSSIAGYISFVLIERPAIRLGSQLKKARHTLPG